MHVDCMTTFPLCSVEELLTGYYLCKSLFIYLTPSLKRIMNQIALCQKCIILKNWSQNQTDFYTTHTPTLAENSVKPPPQHIGQDTLWLLHGQWEDGMHLGSSSMQSCLRLFIATTTIALFIARQLAVLFGLPL